MKATFTFSGCSCGCTPYEHQTVISPNDEKELVKCAAQWMFDHCTHHSDRYCKTSVKSSDVQELEQKAKVIADRLCELDKNKKTLRSSIEKLYVPVFMAQKPYEITPEQKQINDAKKIEYEQVKEQNKIALDKIKQEMFDLTNNSCEYEEDEECD
jgi:hypothetical protein